MSSKERETKTIQEKLMKQFFRLINKGGSGNLKNKNEFSLTDEIEKDISRDAPLHARHRVIKELGDVVLTNKLEDKAIEKLWLCVQDLLQRDQPRESRQLVFWFLQRLLRGQHERLGIMRAHFFRVIKQHDHPEDTTDRFELLNILTANGKDLLYFEEEVGPFLLNWMPTVSLAGKMQDYLELMVNVVKFNAAYLDKVIPDLVSNMCSLCMLPASATVLGCLQVLDAIVCYSSLPSESLTTFIVALCRTVNCEEYCQNSWCIMRHLLGTHMGHSALYTMCRVLQEPTCHQDQLLLRGAVFHVNQALWGTRPLTSLRCTPASVLPSFIYALRCNHPIVVYEVMLSAQGLVNRCGSELHDPAWDMLLDIVESVITHVEDGNSANTSSPVAAHLHDTLCAMEKLVEANQFNGSVTRLYELIERCSHKRPESSVLRLVGYMAETIVPTKHMWLSQLNALVLRYFRQEIRTAVRLRVLEVLASVIRLNRIRYEDELIERIVVPHMQNVAADLDVVVRNSCAELLVDLCLDCDSKRCGEILDILDRILNRPFESVHQQHFNQAGGDTQQQPTLNDAELTDVKTVVSGLIKVFVVKLHRLPSAHFIRVYRMLVNHLESHYARPMLFENSSHIRYKIFDCFLKIRANVSYHLGCPDVSGTLRFSPYLCVQSHQRGTNGASGNTSTTSSSPPPTSPAMPQQHQLPQVTHVSLRHAFHVFITCLREEKDWAVLQLVLQEVPRVLQNKALVLSKQGNGEIDQLAGALCAMLTDKALCLPESLRNASKLPRSEFHSCVLLVLASLASYHAHLDPNCQQRMIRCMVKFGLMPRCCSRHCITALTTCTLEMQDVMVKLLPEVLLDLSKISTTPPIAIPVLEFLSTLTHLPTVFGNFVGDQYMAVFAIALPYTNPFKFNHYTVSLAHHVIAVWFLKCRLPFRRDFVRFITTGLQTNALTPFEETAIMRTATTGATGAGDVTYLNEDSSSRKRSSSLTEQGSRAAAGRRPVDLRGVNIDRALQTFYEEITETAIDLMARYTFSPCSALPKRLPTADFLLSGGQSMTWLLGNKVITVTTSGCAQKPLKQGLCDKCLMLCRDGVISTTTSRQNSSELTQQSPTEKLEQQLPSRVQQVIGRNPDRQLCMCWCQGWAEIHVRRPTGDISWVMRIQNQITQQNNDFPLNDVSNLFMPSLVRDRDQGDSPQAQPAECNLGSVGSMESDAPTDTPSQGPSRQSSGDSAEDEGEPLLYEDGSRARNPVRRTNSSPEMSASWKNPFMQADSKTSSGSEEDGQKKNKNYGYDMRVSCEAIPEEISGAGTTPPTYHPSLLTCRSYPGTQVDEIIDTPSTTVSCTVSKSSSISSGISSVLSASHVDPIIPLTVKPPHSPTQTSPRLSRHMSTEQRPGLTNVDKTSLSLNISAARERAKQEQARQVAKVDNSIPPIRRDRGHTISVMSPVSKPRLDSVRRSQVGTGLRHSVSGKDHQLKSGINPSFVFLQLYHTAYFGSTVEKPLLVGSSQIVQRALKILDRIPPYETHKVGVIYVGPGQCNNETEILRNRFGSARYVDFLSKLGTLIALQDADPQCYFLGGLEQNGNDGKFAYIWQDDVMQVIFHVATLMPCKDSDPSCNNKKLHIGNNYVTIVYNESGEEFNIGTIKGQCNYANVVVQPLDHNTNRVIVKAKDEVADYIGHEESKIISDQNLAVLCRQLALHTNLASMVTSSLKVHGQDPYASNWLERLRKIKQLRTKVLQECTNTNGSSSGGTDLHGPDDVVSTARSRRVQDFTEYT